MKRTFIRNSFVIPRSLSFHDKVAETPRRRGGDASMSFFYTYLPGSNLLQSLSMPNNMTLTQSYETQRNLLTEQRYKRGNSSVTERSYTYNAQNRAIRYTRENSDGTSTVITADYDSMGRRAWKKVETITPNPETGEETTTVTRHHRYIYRGYLQMATCDLTRSAHPCLWLITWNPTQPIATRPLAIQKDRTWYCYGWDLTKNICEIYSTTGYILTYYTYTPYGEVTAIGNTTQPIQWSSEHADTELGMVYYNYRYYNSTDGRWTRRDPARYGQSGNLFAYVNNLITTKTDVLGLLISQNQEQAQRSNRKPASVYVSATGSWSLATSTPHGSIQSLKDTIKGKVKKCECIKELQLLIHGEPTSMIVMGRNDKKEEEKINADNVADVFADLKDSDGKSLFCTSCTIYMDSCHLGLGKIPGIIASTTGCKVRAALGYSCGRPTFPSWSRSREKPGRQEARYLELVPEERSQDQYAYFYPDGRVEYEG